MKPRPLDVRSSIGLAALAVVVAACGGGEGSAGAVTTIRFQFTGEPEEAAVYELLIDAFEAEHANVRVQAEAIGGKADHLAKLVTSFAGDEALRRLPPQLSRVLPVRHCGAMEPIGPQLDDFEVDLGDYYDQPIEAFTFDGELQCLPQNVSSLVVYWNRILFQRAGLAPPTEGGRGRSSARLRWH